MATQTLPEKQQAPQAAVRVHFRDYVERVRGGELGALPAVLGLVVLCVIFSIVRPAFLSAGNFANLFTQGAAVTVIAMGLVFVLLIGEIDLSAGWTSGVCAAVLAVLLTFHGWPWYLAVLAAMLTGALIGLVLGTLVAKVGIPSFVVTLAAFLAFQGVLLLLVKEGTNISIRDETILAIANSNLPPLLGWIRAAVGVGAYAVVQIVQARRRAARGLVADPMGVIYFRIAVLAVIVGAAVYVLNLERSRNALLVSLKGVPIVVPLIVLLLVFWTFVLRRTAYGRHLYAVGGNAEAARRAGINVDRIRISRVRHLLLHGVDRRHHRRVPGELRRPQHGRQQRAALRGGRGRDRRHQPLRRQGPGARRGARRRGRGGDRQRHGPHGLQRRREVHRDGLGAAARRERGRAVPQARRGDRATTMTGRPSRYLL